MIAALLQACYVNVKLSFRHILRGREKGDANPFCALWVKGRFQPERIRDPETKAGS